MNALTRLLRLLVICIVCALGGVAPASASDTANAASLRARYTALAGQQNTQFQRPLYLESVESTRSLKGDIYALLDYPFATVNSTLNGPAHWCDILILHINTKYCRASTASGRTMLAVGIGKKVDQAAEDAHRVEFDYRVVAATPDYLAVQLYAGTGPLSTSDYRILLEATPDGSSGKTILHLTYSYAFGMAGRLAMQAYLATAGHGKVGFTTIGKQANGQPDYIGGVRGVVERNTMRYFLAIDAYLAAPEAAQFEKRIQAWYTATEKYARQLHEVDRAAYVEMKRREYQRQQTG